MAYSILCFKVALTKRLYDLYSEPTTFSSLPFSTPAEMFSFPYFPPTQTLTFIVICLFILAVFPLKCQVERLQRTNSHISGRKISKKSLQHSQFLPYLLHELPTQSPRFIHPDYYSNSRIPYSTFSFFLGQSIHFRIASSNTSNLWSYFKANDNTSTSDKMLVYILICIYQCGRVAASHAAVSRSMPAEKECLVSSWYQQEVWWNRTLFTTFCPKICLGYFSHLSPVHMLRGICTDSDQSSNGDVKLGGLHVLFNKSRLIPEPGFSFTLPNFRFFTLTLHQVTTLTYLHP